MNTDIFYRFDSLADMARYIREVPNPMKWSHSANGTHVRASLDDALRLLSTGWPKGSAKAKGLAQEISAPMLHGSARATHRHFDGDDLDLDRLLLLRTGESNDERVYLARSRARKRAVRVVAYCSYACSVTEDRITLYGAAIAALVDVLESSGVRVELIARSCIHNGSACKRVGVGDVTLKRCDVPLDIDAIALVGHPAFLRRALFAVKERLPKDLREHYRIYRDGNYGVPIHPKQPQEWDPEDTVIVGDDGALSSFHSLRSCIAWLKEQVQQLGGQ